MKALISRQNQVCHAGGRRFNRLTIGRLCVLLPVWICAAFLLAACGSQTAAVGLTSSPTAPLTSSAATPTVESSSIAQTISPTLAAPSAIAPARSGATLTPWPTNTLAFPPSATPAAGTPWPACDGSSDSRLQVGATAAVSQDPPQANNVRNGAGASQRKVGQIQPGERVTVLDGPRCVDGWVWWKIRSLDNGLTGWTAEGDKDSYWLVPQP